MAYDYANLKTYKKSQIGGLTKHLASLRFRPDDELPFNREPAKLWDRIFKRAAEFGMEIGYSHAHGERLDFKQARKITREQSDFGKRWMKDYFFKMNGEPRNGKRTQYLSGLTLQIAKNVSRFEFVGVQVLASSGWYPCQVVPIYRAYNRKGEYFEYAPIHWSDPIVME